MAWAIELYKEGFIGDAETGGMKLDWNDPETAALLLDDIAYRRGFGDILAEGASEASAKFGEDSAGRMMWVKGLPQSDPVDLRFIKAFALGVSTATRGADHLRSRCPWEAFEFDKEFLAGIYGGPVETGPAGIRWQGPGGLVVGKLSRRCSTRWGCASSWPSTPCRSRAYSASMCSAT